MADMNKKEIKDRFDKLRFIEPDKGAARAAIDKARTAVIDRTGGKVKKTFIQSPVFKFAIAACLVAAVFAGFALLTNDNSTIPDVVKNIDPSTKNQDTNRVASVTQNKDNSLQAKLAELERLFAAGDVKGLLAMLDDADEKIRLAAAGLLAKIGGADAINKLTDLSLAFNGKGDDPYMLAIAEIEDNLKQQQDSEDKPEEEAEVIEMQRPFEVEVIDKLTQEPVAGAVVTLKFNVGKDWVEHNMEKVTDTDGYCLFDLGSEKLTRMEVIVKPKGYMIMKAQARDGDLLKGVADVIFELEKGVPIGGVIIDEQDQPIEGVEVAISKSYDESRRKFVPWIVASGTVTAKDGRWRRVFAREDFDKIRCRFKHPDYVDDRYTSYLSRKFSEDMLLAEKTVTVMVKGIYVS